MLGFEIRDEMARSRNNEKPWGGPWTQEKLRILEGYLENFTTALKRQDFKLVYIDAFAGSGSINLPNDDESNEYLDLVKGSAALALDIDEKPFDRLIFIETSKEKRSDLEDLATRYPGRDIEIESDDANRYISQISLQPNERGVVFLDPFSTGVSWSTIEHIAMTEQLDTWLLFPVMAISRLLPVKATPESIDENHQTILTRVYGSECWKDLYSDSPQPDLFDHVSSERDRGVHKLIEIFKNNLSALVGPRLLENVSGSLVNSNNSTLFELIFFTGSRNNTAIELSQRIARHLLNRLGE